MVEFKEDVEISNFIETFEQHNTVLPYEKFGFCQDLLSYCSPSLLQFCVKFGKFVKVWEILTESTKAGSPTQGNIKTLLENCQNVEEISHFIWKVEVGGTADLPPFYSLKTINIKYAKVPTTQDFLFLLNQILKVAPYVRNFSIENRKCETEPPTRAINLLKQLYRFNQNFHINKLDLFLLTPVNNIDELNNLIEISTKFPVAELKLLLIPPLRDANSALVGQTHQILSRWILKLAFLRKLSLVFKRRVRDTVAIGYAYEARPIVIPLDSLKKLEYLEVYFLHTPVGAIPMEFPVLTTLNCRNCEILKKFNFAGYVFPNVRYANISLKTEEELERWPLMIPNVQELEVVSETFQEILQFSKLRKLKICVESNNNPGTTRLQWKYLTGGAKLINNDRICKCAIRDQRTSELVDFRNLPELTYLTLSNEKTQCWKGVIYASRTGHLGRLKKLALSFKGFKEEKDYRQALLKYHDSVVIASNTPSTFQF